jgi:hypothetical protein
MEKKSKERKTFKPEEESKKKETPAASSVQALLAARSALGEVVLLESRWGSTLWFAPEG